MVAVFASKAPTNHAYLLPYYRDIRDGVALPRFDHSCWTDLFVDGGSISITSVGFSWAILIKVNQAALTSRKASMTGIHRDHANFFLSV
ncbi:MAG: hypothetical protein ACI8Z5_002069 [Lentimonas sp.]